MEVEKTDIEGAYVITPRVFKDARGYFFESFSEREFHAAVGPVCFVQDNESCSSHGVVRGLHFQCGDHAQAKLVRVVEGCVLDVAVDIRPDSPTFGRHIAVELSADNHKQLFIPRGCAHGFSVLSPRAVFQYKCDNYYSPESEGGIAWDDAELNIDWRIPADQVILSAKDSARPTLREWMARRPVQKQGEPIPDGSVVLVTGAAGQLGRSIKDISGEYPYKFIFTDIEELDITSAEDIERMMKEVTPAVIINCAAYTNVDAAEDDFEGATRLNAIAPGLLAEAAARHDAALIHVSTDYVFGATGANTPIAEDAPTGPTGVYGETKLEGERRVRASGCRHVIVRTAWLYSEYGRNFVKTMRRLMAERDTVSVVEDQIGTPTYAHDLATALLGLIHAMPQAQIFHYTDEGVASWYDFARAIRELSGYDSCDVRPCTGAEFPSKVKRPAYSVLDKSKIKDYLGCDIPHWRSALEVCLQCIKAGSIN